MTIVTCGLFVTCGLYKRKGATRYAMTSYGPAPLRRSYRRSIVGWVTTFRLREDDDLAQRVIAAVERERKPDDQRGRKWIARTVSGSYSPRLFATGYTREAALVALIETTRLTEDLRTAQQETSG